MDKSLDELYKDPKLGYTSLERFYNNLKRAGYTYSRKEIKEFLNKNPTEQLHKQEKRVFLPIITTHIRQQYQIDLVILVKSSSKLTDVVENIKKTDLRYVMTLIDCYSRKADCRFMKNKTPENTLNALKSMIADMGKPEMITGDKGREWLGVFREYCNDNEIKLILKDNDGKYSNSMIERFNRTFINYIKRWKTDNPKKGIIQLSEKFPDFIENYNNSYHTSIKTNPNNSWDLGFTMEDTNTLSKEQFARTQFQVGDKVRVRLTRTIYTKGRVNIWSKEIFKITEKNANRYTLDKPFENRTEFSYNSLRKIE